MSTSIYYFSGTGNSLHIARELQKRIPNVELIPIVKLLNESVIKVKSKRIGVVFPVYITMMPIPVRQFLNKLYLGKAEYIFAVITRMGTFQFNDILLKKILKKQGRKLNSYFFINMANNTPTGLKPGPGDKKWPDQIAKNKIMKFENEVKVQLDQIQDVVLNNEKYPKKEYPNTFRDLFANLFDNITKNTMTEIKFYTDQSCNGCGICEKVCPSTKVKMTSGKPEWQKDVQCYYCYSCFNFCPEQSILVRDKYTLKTGRYFHPEINAKDIAGQK